MGCREFSARGFSLHMLLGMVLGAVLYAVNAYADRVDTWVSIKIALSQ
jgi:hypothetical protein